MQRELLPADDSGYGFDNIADVLSVSPGLLDRYMLAAGKIGRLAVGDPTMKPTVVTYRTPPLAAQDDRMSEDLPFGSRGGLAVRHQFPTDGEYAVRLRLQRTYVDIIRGLAQPHRLDVRLDHALVKSFVVGGAMSGDRDAVNPQEYLRNGDKDLELRVAVKGGPALLGAAFVKEPVLAEGLFQPRPPLASFEYAGKSDTDPAIDAIEIHGPYDAKTPETSPSRQQDLRLLSRAVERGSRVRGADCRHPGAAGVSAAGERRGDQDAAWRCTSAAAATADSTAASSG